MINSILQGIMSLIINLVSILLKPIDSLISTVLPDLDSAFTAIGQFLGLCGNGLGWVVSLSGLSSECISLIVMYFIFKLTAPLLFSTIKLAISWYNKLKP